MFQAVSAKSIPEDRKPWRTRELPVLTTITLVLLMSMSLRSVNHNRFKPGPYTTRINLGTHTNGNRRPRSSATKPSAAWSTPGLLTLSVATATAGKEKNTQMWTCAMMASMRLTRAARTRIQPVEWQGLHTKPVVLLQYLQQANQIADNQIVAFADAYDVMFVRNPNSREVIESWFDEVTGKAAHGIVFNAECNCFPRGPLCDTMAQLYASEKQNSPFVYLNSGIFVGRKRDLMPFLQQFMIYLGTPEGAALAKTGTDQAVFQKLCFCPEMEQYRAAAGTKCFLDIKQSLLMGMYPTMTHDVNACPGMGFSNHTLYPGPGKYNNIINPHQKTPCLSQPTQQSGCLFNPVTKTQPTLLHFNGRSRVRSYFAELLRTFLRTLTRDLSLDQMRKTLDEPLGLVPELVTVYTDTQSNTTTFVKTIADNDWVGNDCNNGPSSWMEGMMKLHSSQST